MATKIIHGLLIGVVTSILLIVCWAAGWLEWLENPLWDWRVRVLARPGKATESIRLVLLDQSSLDWAKEQNGLTWPWPRQVYEPLLAFCQRGGARAVAFDLVFSEPSRWGVEDDRLFGDAIGRTTGFVAAVFLSSDQGLTRKWPAELGDQLLPVRGLEAFLVDENVRHLVLPRASFPIPEVCTNASLLGNVAAGLDKDAVIRRVEPFRVFDGRFVPSLGLALLLVSEPGLAIDVSCGYLRIGAKSVPLDKKGRTVLRYRGPSQTHKAVNAAAVIQSELRLREGGVPVLPPSFFRDTYVFFGVTAPGLLDLRPTPVSSVYPGVEIHATLFDNVLSGDLIRDASVFWVVIAVLLFGLGSGIVGRLCATGWQMAAALVLILPLPLLLGFVAYEKGVWFPVGVQEGTVVATLLGAAIVNYAVEGKQKRFIKSAFKQYLSPAVIEELVKNPDQLKLGGEARELSIFFSDVQGFTTLSESLSPEALTTLLNEYLTAMTDIILEEGGTIDKYEGDAIIAFWNAPLQQSDHAVRAVRAALRCQTRLAELRPGFARQVGRELHTRIGINTGRVVVGNMGSNQRFDYTFLGDAGNLASRLEGLNKQFGTYILISEFTRRQLSEEFAAREVSLVQVVGRREPVRVYEPFSAEEFVRRRAVLDRFAQALEAYYAGRFGQALKIFREIAEQDAPARAYVRKCEWLVVNPPTEWNGVWVMTEK
ncbi:MAG: adenylate/guanylate cyclase domain-containing protein [Kiritimatiellae bacterium]|nr:adenylate/guanylate cyclase domain-containing protein [Kiritimatiellia bacterium]